MQQHPVAFIRTFLSHVRLWSAMEMILESVWLNKRTSVRACHGISKTFCAALSGITFLNLFPRAIVVTSAPTGRQVERLLWKDINAIYATSGGRLKGHCQTVQVKIAPDWYMYGFSTDYATNMEGHHAPAILWILDEAKGLPKWLYDSAEGSMTGGFSRILEISTTDGAGQQCPLRLHHTTDTGRWKCIHLSAFDSPLVAMDDPDFEKYRRLMNPDLVKYGRPEHGTEWPLEIGREIQLTDKAYILDHQRDWEIKEPETWKTKIGGDFSTLGEDVVIPLEWIMAATNNTKVKPRPERTCFGLDVGELGTDSSVLTERNGGVVQPQETWQGVEPMQLAGRVVLITAKRGPIHIDKIGVGSGPFWRLLEMGHPVVGVDSAASPLHDTDEEAFLNLRAEMWWHARAVFLRNYEEGDVLSIPDDPALREELSAVHYEIRSDGRIKIEEKKKIIKRIGRSPDKGDSLIYCLANLPAPVQEELPPDLQALLMGGPG